MLVDSNEQKLSFPQIVKTALEETGGGRPVKDAMDLLTIELNQPGVKPYRFGNTIFILHQNEEREDAAYFRALNADLAQNYVNNSIKFIAAAADDGFKILVTRFDDDRPLQVMNIFRKQASQVGISWVVQNMKNGGYQAIFQLGKNAGSQQ